jgi:hypothetical protein
VRRENAAPSPTGSAEEQTMKKALKIAGISLAGLFLLVTVVGLFLPTKIHVQRSIEMRADAKDVYPLIANLKDGWTQWSPFGVEEDPGMQMKYSGAEEGVGATQSWDGPKMGDGRMTIVKADPARGAEYDLWVMHDSFRIDGALICEPAAGGTKVTWTGDWEYGSNPYERYMGLLADGMLGDSFEKGLNKLKRKVEARAVAAPNAAR